MNAKVVDMDNKINELLIALKVADECRSSDPNGQRICGPCWANVATAAKAIDPVRHEVLFG